MKRSQTTAFLSLFTLFFKSSLLTALSQPATGHAAGLAPSHHQSNELSKILGTSYLEQNDGAFAKHSKSADFLFASSQKLLLKWNGQLAAAALSALVSIPSERPSGNLPNSVEIFERSLPPKHRSDFARTGAPISAEDPVVAGFVCFSGGVLMIFEPTSHDLTTHTEYLTTERIFGASETAVSASTARAGMKLTGFTRIVGCSLNTKGELLLMHEDATGLHLGFPLSVSPNTRLLNKLYSTSNSSSEALTLGSLEDSDAVKPGLWVIVSKSRQTLELFDDSLEAIARFTGFNTSTDSKLAIRGRHVLMSREGIVTLAIYDFEKNSFESKRLNISPCDDDTTCAVSLGSDESWAVSGYWGTFIGVKQEFKRIPLRNFSQQNFPIVFSHSAAKGQFAVFGADDADMGSLERLSFSTPQTLRVLGEATPLESGTVEGTFALTTFSRWTQIARETGGEKSPLGVAWLKLGATMKQGELALFQVEKTKVILTPFGFDPRRFAAFEANAQLPALQDSRPLPALQASGTWWKNAIDLPGSLALLESEGLEPRPVRIALLDSGSDFSHPDFHPKTTALKPQPDYDFVDQDNDPSDLYGHGTHVSGLAKPYDPSFSKLFRNTEVLTVRVLDKFGKSNTIDIGMGFLYAADKQSDIINASWGGGARTQFMEDCILYAYERGALVITSAGNDGLNLDDLNPEPAPGGFKGVLAIGATRNRGTNEQRAQFSNYGQARVFGFTPGETVSSLKRGGGFVDMSGTSMAAPIASAMFGVALGVWRIENHGSDWRPKIQEAFCSTAARDLLSKESRCGALNLREALEFLNATSLAHKVTDDIRSASQIENTERRANEWQN